MTHTGMNAAVWIITVAFAACLGPGGAECLGAPAADGPDAAARAIVEAAGVRAGLCVHLGCGDGRLTAGLARAGDFLVQGLAADAAAVAAARQALASAGLAERASAAECSPTRLPHAENMANLLVAEDLPGLVKGGLSPAEVLRVVTPGGVAMLGAGPGGTDAALTAVLEKAGLGDVQIVRQAGVWAKVRKPRPAGMDEWTHWRHDAAGNQGSHDEIVQPPARLKWIDGEPYGDSGGREGAAFVSAGGRFFHTLNDTPSGIDGPMRPFLVARDAFNGLVLWKKPLPSLYLKFPDQQYNRVAFKRRTLVAEGDRVYVVLTPDGPLSMLDAATGETLATFAEAGPPEEVLYCEGALILAGGGPVRSIDPRTGKERWKSGLATQQVIAGGGRVYLSVGDDLVALEVATGKELWRGRAGRTERFVYYYKEVLAFRSGASSAAISAKDGKPLWTYKYPNVFGGRRGYHFTPDFGLDGLCWVHSIPPGSKADSAAGEKPLAFGGAFIGLDPATGKVMRRVPHTSWNYRCYPNFATPNFFLGGDGRILELRTGVGSGTSLTRGACSLGFLTANGLVYNLPQGCQCSSTLRGIMACTGGDYEKFSPDPLADPSRFRKGPAFGKPAPGEPAKDDWPTYRADPARSASASADLPAKIEPVWTADLKGKISSPVVAGGKVFVSAVDAHEVIALDAAGGKTLWRHTVEGRIDAPPTIHQGLCLLGTAAGWVHCLRADDGQPVWSLRAAPKEHLIMAYGQLESSWPVQGGVLVQNGVAYFAAGRSSESIGGIFAYAADPATGRIVWHSSLKSFSGSYRMDPETDKVAWSKPRKVLGTDFAPPVVEWARNEYWGNSYRIHDILLGDLLVGGEDAVHMREWAFNHADGKAAIKGDGLHTTAGGASLLTHTTFMKRIYHSWRLGPEFAQMLVFDKANAYGFRNRDKLGEGVQVFGKPTSAARGKWTWSVQVPLRVRAMAVAGKTLVLAGTPDAPAGVKDPWAAWLGQEGGELHLLSAADGSTLAKVKLPAVPYFDGLAAAGGKLYVSTAAGTVVCLAPK